MSSNFLEHAEFVIQSLEKEVAPEKLTNDPVFLEISQLVENVKTNNYPEAKVRVSITALNLQDDGVYESDQLVKDIIHLEELYKILKRTANNS